MSVQHLPVATGSQTWQWVSRQLRNQYRSILACVLLLLGASAGAFAIPMLLGKVIDLITIGAPTTHLWVTCSAILCVGLLSASLGYGAAALLVTIMQSAVAELRETVVSEVLFMPVAQVESTNSADIISRVTRDVETIVVSFIGIATLYFRLAGAALLAVPIQLLATRFFVCRAHRIYADTRTAESDRSQAILETVVGADTIRAYRLGREATDSVNQRSQHVITLLRRAARVRNRFWFGLNTAELVGLSAVIAVGFWLVDAKVISIGAATAAALFFHRLFDPVGMLLTQIDDIQRAAVGLSRLVGVLSRTQRQPRPTATVAGEPGAGIELTDVSFGYHPERLVLKEISLTVAPGSRVALVGVSGSGKSTLARIIAGAFPPDTGRITIGGTLVCENDSRVATVTQEVHVFSTTLAANLRLGRSDATDAELWNSLDTVGAH